MPIKNKPKVKPFKTPSDIYNLYKETAGDNQPLFHILELVHRAGAKYCILWNDDSNSEWQAEHSELYSKIYPHVANKVLRLDFFSAQSYLDSNCKYYGYVALRPGPLKTVVESVISPPTISNHYLLCGSNYETSYPDQQGNLVKNVIQNACPFVQQDGVIGICAHASIRMLSMILSKRYSKCKSMTIKEINQKVSAMPLFEGSHLPSTGLASFEIVNAIEGMGATAVLYLFERGKERTKGLPIERVIYPYVESGIPVIVGIGTESAGHAVLVVGHTFDQDSWWQHAEAEYYPSLGSGASWIPSYLWTPEFIIQDDNFGPYMSSPRTLLGLSTLHVIVPTPNECPIFLPGYMTEFLVAGYLLADKVRPYVLPLTKIRKPWSDVLPDVFKKGNVVLRPILIKKEDFFKHLDKISLSNTAISAYKKIKLPSWIWSIEVSVPGLYSRGEKIGEVLLNPTYPSQHLRNGDEPLLGMRLFDVMFTDNSFTNSVITGDLKPVSVFTRPTF
jgi:hypothetical protein